MTNSREVGEEKTHREIDEKCMYETKQSTENQSQTSRESKAERKTLIAFTANERQFTYVDEEIESHRGERT